MDSGAPGTDATTKLPRAGFWRRWLAILIDGIIVMFPFQILAAVLFAMTAGMIQMDSGFFSSCDAASSIPQDLNPPPPHDSNFAQVCHVTLLGWPTGATLTVGRVTREGAATTTVSQGYMLDRHGTPINGTSIDWIVELVFIAYLVGMVWKTGQTLGAGIVGVRVIDTANPSISGIPLRKVIVRYLAMIIGALPAFALLIYQRTAVGGSADAMFIGDFFRWFALAGVLGALWVLLLIVQIARKSDPVYDRLAGTAVVRD